MSGKNDLQSIIKDIEGFAGGRPQEDILKPLIEADTLDLLVVGKTKADFKYKILCEAMKVYCACYGGNIKLRFVEETEADKSLEKAIQLYNLKQNVEFISEEDRDTQLSYYLGSDFAFFIGDYDKQDAALLKAQYFYLPILIIDAGNETAKQENVLRLSSDPTEIAAALRVLKNNNNYRKLLGKDSRCCFNRAIGN